MAYQWHIMWLFRSFSLVCFSQGVQSAGCNRSQKAAGQKASPSDASEAKAKAGAKGHRICSFGACWKHQWRRRWKEWSQFWRRRNQSWTRLPSSRLAPLGKLGTDWWMPLGCVASSDTVMATAENEAEFSGFLSPKWRPLCELRCRAVEKVDPIREGSTCRCAPSAHWWPGESEKSCERIHRRSWTKTWDDQRPHRWFPPRTSQWEIGRNSPKVGHVGQSRRELLQSTATALNVRTTTTIYQWIPWTGWTSWCNECSESELRDKKKRWRLCWSACFDMLFDLGNYWYVT